MSTQTVQPGVGAATDLARWGEGFYGPETEDGRPFRWMGASASIVFEPTDRPRHLELAVKCHFDDASQRLTETAGEAPPESFDLLLGWNLLSLEVPPGTSVARLSTNKLLAPEDHPGDGRQLGIQLRPPLLHDDPAQHARVRGEQEARSRSARRLLDSPLGAFQVTARGLRYEEGFYHPENDEGLPFRWMSREGRIDFPTGGPRFLEIWARSHFRDGSQRLTLATATGAATYELVDGWNALSLPVAAGEGWARLTASKALPRAHHPQDPRALAVQVRPAVFHEDAAHHGHVLQQHENRVRNWHELLSGAVELASTPPKLGIDITGSCNVKPPCVYCQWDFSKEREGDNVDVPFNVLTLREYGPFFDNAFELVNCSIGEPFMVKDIDLLLDAFGARGKLLELTTNGQILTDTNIRKLLGRNVHLYVSLDAATPETYGRLRNRSFEKILDNLRRLVDAKGGPGRNPLVYLVFMPMRANAHEVDAFVELCARLRVDRLVLRPLNPSPGIDLRWERAGYHYDYQKELLPFEELVRLSGRVAQLCRRLGVPLSDQMDFGGEMGPRFKEAYEQGRRAGAEFPPPDPAAPSLGAPPELGAPPDQAPAPEGTAPQGAEDRAGTGEASATLGDAKLPICTEPWTSLYVLRRGTLPCCYGGGPVAPMADFKRAWNSPLVQDIRRELREGRFHRYCFDSPDCPIVRKAEEARDLSMTQEALLVSRRLLNRVRRSGYGVPGKIFRISKHYWRLGLARVRRVLGRARPSAV